VSGYACKCSMTSGHEYYCPLYQPVRVFVTVPLPIEPGTPPEPRYTLAQIDEMVRQAWLQVSREGPYEFGLDDLLKALENPDKQARLALKGGG
jgi:hypothetical protein